MSVTERLRILIEGDSKGATTALGRFRASISEATGVSGKLKAGWASASESIRANAAALAVAGGAALVAFGVKALAAFEGTAKAAIDMGKATGLATEAASRWIAVGEDFGVTADQLTGAMGRLGKNMDSDAMKKYGIETRDAAGHAIDANSIFMDVLETLNNTAPAERSKVAAELLGKGWQSIAPLLGKTRGEYEKMLGSVEEGQVITAKEAAKAERMRLAQDRLKETMERVTLAVGEFVSELAPMVERGAAVVETVTDVTEAVGGLKTALDLVSHPVGSVFDGTARDALLELEGGVISATVAADAFPGRVNATTLSLDEMTDAGKEAAQAAYELSADAEKAAAQAANLARDIKAAHTAFTQWSDELDDDKSLIDLEIELRGAQEALEGLDPLEKESALLGFKQHIRDVARGLDYIPEKVITDVVQTFDGTNYDSIIARLQTLQSLAAAGIHINVTTGAIVTTADAAERRIETATKVKGKRAAGGPVSSGGAYLVGELGPEIVNIPGGSNVTPNSQLGGGTTNVSINVSVAPGADPVSVGRATADALAAYYRNGGQRP